MELSACPSVEPTLKTAVQPMHWTAFHNYLHSASGVRILLKAKREDFAAEAKHSYDMNYFHYRHLPPGWLDVSY